MKNIFFTAGPSQIYPTVPKHINKAIKTDILSLSHRSAAFQEMFKSAQDSLRKLLNIPKENHIFFIASANEGWERIIENTVEKQSFHFVNGAFGKRLYQISSELKKTPLAMEVADGEGFNFADVKIPEDTELVCLTHNESSTGVMLPIDEIHTLKRRYPDVLFALDTVSSIPYVDIDYSLIDCVYFSVQKGFGLPAGLGVLIITPAAMEKAVKLQNKGLNIGSYHSFPELLKYEQKFQAPETPNVLNIYLLGKVTDDLLKIGIQKIRKQTETKAGLLNKFIEKNEKYKFFVPFEQNRSKTVFTVKTPNNSAETIAKLKKHGLVVGKGYGKYKEEYIRISNFPAHTLKNVKKLIQYL